MTLEEVKALIARVDAADKAGVEFTAEVMQEFGYVQDEGGVWELPIPMDIAEQLTEHEELVEAFAALRATKADTPEDKRAGHKLMNIIFRDVNNRVGITAQAGDKVGDNGEVKGGTIIRLASFKPADASPGVPFLLL